MADWRELETAEPEFASRVRAVFDVRKHKTLATLRKDGSPRISGIEIAFAEGEIRLGMMPGSVKARDVLRDPRLAVHSPTVDTPEDDPGAWAGEAKVSGRAVQVAPPEGGSAGSAYFRIDLDEVVLTRVGSPADHLVIESWTPSGGLRRRVRH
ncbi:pyridoxamine 5'-phosphate oxidase family protein [Streptacidiphilus monticola]|uniref:Pyridoxamine 5'-phosphate oxidase family protein n=1 Tax=Streptacidiphilus monticola TaxID=2161674 RepID=A0ABW1FVG3_9ACTN